MTRRRWVYIEGKPLEVSEDFKQSPEEAAFHVVGDRHYDGLRATDGVDISTRRKHREYMKRNDLTTMDDFTETWKKEAKLRENRFKGIDPTRKRDMAEAIEKLQSGYKPQIRRQDDGQ